VGGKLPPTETSRLKGSTLMKTRQRPKTGAGLVLILLAMTCGPYFAHADEAEDAAVKVIQDLGGRITRDEKARNKPIVGADLTFTKVTGAGLKELAGLKQLQRLYLESTKVTDAGLKELAPLTHLQWLHLENTKVTDAGANNLKKALP